MKRVLWSLTGALAALSWGALGHAASPWDDIGRDATPAEVRAWDIDVRPDFKGLPAGRGSVADGAQVWEARCAGCHGVFGDSSDMATAITGGITAQDIQSGRVAGLRPESGVAQRSTLMKVATVSTLWDYINRAMPWDAPKSLRTDEVYAVLAYMLSLDEIVDADFVLDADSIRRVQQRMPNRNGMVRHEDLWRTQGRGDVVNVACMRQCPVQAQIKSALPDYVRNAHGNLQLQNRIVGAVRGVMTTAPPAKNLGEARRIAQQATVCPMEDAAHGPDALANKSDRGGRAIDRCGKPD